MNGIAIFLVSAATVGWGAVALVPALRELMRLNARAIFSHVTCPMLLMGGEKDLQCDPADIERIAKLAKGAIDKQVIKNLTHILRFDERQASLLGSAELIKKPMEPIVLELIAAWLMRRI